MSFCMYTSDVVGLCVHLYFLLNLKKRNDKQKMYDYLENRFV